MRSIFISIPYSKDRYFFLKSAISSEIQKKCQKIKICHPPRIGLRTGLPTDPSATKRTSFTLLSSSCTVGEQNLTYLVELTERGPNIRPAFPERLRVAVTSIPAPIFPTDLQTTTARRPTTPTDIPTPTTENHSSSSKE